MIKLKPIGVKIVFDHFGSDTKDVELSIHIFRIIQELISNSLKYPKANTITVHINTFGDFINIVYEDDGVGFDHVQVRRGLGLHNIEARIQSINGKCDFTSGKFGVTYNIEVPLH